MSAPQVLPSVATARLPELDLRGAAFTAEPDRVLRELLAVSPVVRSRRGVEILSYELISQALVEPTLDTADAEHYRRLGAGNSLLRFVEDGLLSTMERDRHDPIRRLLMKAFALQRIEVHRAMMRDVASGLIERFVDDSTVDLVDQLTEFYPIEVLCRMIGVPSADIPAFAAAAHELHLMAAVPMAPGFPRLEKALDEMETYVAGLLAERRARPRADFLSSLLVAQEDEGRLSEPELVGNLVNLIFAGMGTTTMQLASAVQDLVEHDLWDRLHAEPQLVRAAVEECLRYSPVTQFVVRIPLEDTAFAGYLFPKGERMILNLLAGSRDPRQFPEPDSFDIGRTEVASRLPFGWGVHRCLGHALARGLIEEALVLLIERMTEVRVVARGAGPAPSAMLGGPDRLVLSFRRRDV